MRERIRAWAAAAATVAIVAVACGCGSAGDVAALAPGSAAAPSTSVQPSEPAPSRSASESSGTGVGGVEVPSSGGTAATPPPSPQQPAGRPGQSSATDPAGRSKLGAIGESERPATVGRELERYWSATFPTTFRSDYVPLAGGLAPYHLADGEPSCGTKALPAELAINNAFYCGADDAIAWDGDGFLTRLGQVAGPFAEALVFAHEWGHVVQHRVGGPPPGPVRELQADCYAGSWAGWMYSGSGREALVDAADLDEALGGFLSVRDTSVDTGADSGGHGNAFDRVNAFEQGFSAGAAACATYVSRPPKLSAPGFVQPSNAVSMTVSDTVDLVTVDLENYWQIVVATQRDLPPDGATPIATQAGPVGKVQTGNCQDPSIGSNGVTLCRSERTISWDLAALDAVNSQVGDFGVAMALALAWSRLAGAELQPYARSPSDMGDCYAGSWAADAAKSLTPTGLQLSAGDLDEAVSGMLMSRAIDPRSGEITAFRRAHAFFAGFDKGRSGCTVFA